MDNMEIVKNEVKNIMDDLETIKNFERKITETLKPLKKWTEEINIFSILKIDTYEIRHSNMLSWLIDPNGNHGVEDKFLKKLLDKSFNNIRTDNMDWTDTIVYREKENIDILVVSDKNRLVCAIENKIFSDEHDDQLKRYREWLEDTYKDKDKDKDFTIVLYYLTPYGIKPTDENWQTLDYEFILESLEDCLKNPKLNEKTTIYIKDYINAVRRSVVMKNTELIKVCNEIYMNNKEALDLIYENKFDVCSNVRDICLNFLNENEDKYNIHILERQTKSEIAFTPEELKNDYERYANKQDIWGGEDCVMIGLEIHNKPDSNLEICLYIGPSEENAESSKVRDKIIQTAKAKEYKMKNKKFILIKTDTLVAKEDIENYANDYDNLKNIICKSIEEFLSNNLKKITDDFKRESLIEK